MNENIKDANFHFMLNAIEGHIRSLLCLENNLELNMFCLNFDLFKTFSE